jgi:hypothetical protein
LGDTLHLSQGAAIRAARIASCVSFDVTREHLVKEACGVVKRCWI